MPESYNQVQQTRTAIGTPNTWVAVTIPIGARNPLLSVEDTSASFRVSTDNSLNPSNQGVGIPAKGSYAHEGVNTNSLTLYISASIATTAFLIFTLD